MATLFTLTLTRLTRRTADFRVAKQFFPVMFGTVVEYYDYTLYGFCAELLAEQFFPVDDPTVALLKTFGIFLAGSCAKPLGALLFGYIGDRYGRSVSLKISMLGIAIPTTCIGLMPTYQQIGGFAPALLLFFRILQGVLTSGESDSARVFMFESFFKSRPCVASVMSGIACMVGIYLASVVSSFVIALAVPTSWWRLPFILGGLMGAGVFLGRRVLHETSVFIRHKTASHNPSQSILLKNVLNNKRIILTAILFCGASGGTYHFYLVFLGKYLSILGIGDLKNSAFITSIGVFVYTAATLPAAFLADRFGYVQIIKISFYILFWLIALNVQMLSMACMPIALMGVTAVALAFFQTPMFVLLLERTNVAERCQCLGFGHAVGSMLFSGSTPLISLWLWQITGIVFIPFVYFVVLICMGFLGIFFLKNKC